MKDRKEGYYWVCIFKNTRNPKYSEWIISEWDGKYWNVNNKIYDDIELFEIDENQIIRKEESNYIDANKLIESTTNLD